MMQLSLLAAVPTWVSNWLTPIWLVGLGTLIGLAVLLILWGVAFLLSRIPMIGSLAEDPKRRNIAMPSLSVASFFGLLAGLMPRLAAPDGTYETETVIVASLVMVPFAILVGAGLVWLTSRRTVAEVPQAVREGALWPLFLIAVGFATFAFVGGAIATNPKEILQSIGRVPFAGTTVLSEEIAGTPLEVLDDVSRDPPQYPIQVDIRSDELHAFMIETNQKVSIDTKQSDKVDLNPFTEIAEGDEYTWNRRVDSGALFDEPTVPTLYVRNYGLEPAVLKITMTNRPLHPEVASVWLTAFAVVATFLLYLVQRAALPKMSAIALATVKSELAQPLFLIVILLGLFAILMFMFIPYNTFGEDIKVLKDSGMVLIKVLSVILAVWAASNSIADEIEGKTALTVLSKPLLRRSFILGKYLGIFWTVLIVFVILGGFLLLIVAYKPIYDAKESSAESPVWQVCHFEMVSVVPGLVLAFMETCILAAISVAISTRLPMLANFIISFAIYVVGHLTPLLVQSSVEGKAFEAVVFVAQLLSTVFPVLDHFSIEAAVAAGVSVPYTYLGWALLYSLVYGMIALLLALVLFEDRDLA